LQVNKAMAQDENFNNDFLSICHLPYLIALDKIGVGTLRIIWKNFGLKAFDILKYQIALNFRYVDGIPTLAKLLISLKAVVKSRKYQIGLL